MRIFPAVDIPTIPKPSIALTRDLNQHEGFVFFDSRTIRLLLGRSNTSAFTQHPLLLQRLHLLDTATRSAYRYSPEKYFSIPCCSNKALSPSRS